MHKKIRWGDSFFFRVFASMSALSFIIILILSTILAARSTEAAFSQINLETANHLEGMGNSVESRMREMMQLNTVLTTDEDIYAFLNSVEPDSRTQLRTQNKCRKLKNISALIESMVLFNTVTNEQIIIGTAIPVSIDDHMRNLKAHKKDLYFPEVFHVAEQDRCLITMPFYANPTIEGAVTNGIILYLKPEAFLDSILGMIAKCRYPDAIVRLLHLVLNCSKAMRQLPGGTRRESLDIDEFMRMETLDDARRRLVRLFDEYTKLSQECAPNLDDKHSANIPICPK